MLDSSTSTKRTYASWTNAVACSVWPGFSWTNFAAASFRSFLIHHRQELLGRMGITWINSLQDTGDFVHLEHQTPIGMARPRSLVPMLVDNAIATMSVLIVD